MFETKIRRVGNSAVITLSKEALAVLDAVEGGSVFLVRTDDRSLAIRARDDDFAAAMDAAEDVMNENRAALQALA